jgi:hypothetical protein
MKANITMYQVVSQTFTVLSQPVAAIVLLNQPVNQPVNYQHASTTTKRKPKKKKEVVVANMCFSPPTTFTSSTPAAIEEDSQVLSLHSPLYSPSAAIGHVDFSLKAVREEPPVFSLDSPSPSIFAEQNRLSASSVVLLDYPTGCVECLKSVFRPFIGELMLQLINKGLYNLLYHPVYELTMEDTESHYVVFKRGMAYFIDHEDLCIETCVGFPLMVLNRYVHTLAAQRINDSLRVLMRQCNEAYHTQYSSVLVHYLLNGEDYIEAQSIQKPWLLQHQKCLVLSFGASRKFRMAIHSDVTYGSMHGLNICTHNAAILPDGSYEFEMQSGDVLNLVGDVHSHFTFSVPTDSEVSQPSVFVVLLSC